MDNKNKRHIDVPIRILPQGISSPTNQNVHHFTTTRGADGRYYGSPISYNTNAVILGTAATGEPVSVSDIVRQSGMYVLGIQGRGKSSLLEQIIYQDICKGYSVIILDPHGDLIDHCIAQMPADRLKDAYLLDLEDETHPFGVNLFSAKKHTSAIAQTQAVDRVMHVFEAVWGDVLKQQNLPRYLRAGILTLMQNPGTTLVDLYPFLQLDDYRQKLLRNVRDDGIKQFWQYQYDDLTPAARKRETSSLVNRLESLFMGRSLISNILGQSQTTIDFRNAIENREIIFIKLPIQTIPQDAALIGTMLIAQIHAAIFSFKDVPLAHRPTYSIFIDEFQNFVTTDIEEIFTQGRKFGSRLCVAHQIREQLPRYLAKTTIGAQTIICFQTTHDDASDMSPVFSGMEHKTTDIDINPLAQLDDYPNPTVKEYWRDYIDKLDDASGQRIKSGVVNKGTIREKIWTVYPKLDFGYGRLNTTPEDAGAALDLINILIYESEKQGRVSEQHRRQVHDALKPLFTTGAYQKELTKPEERRGYEKCIRQLDAVLAILIAQPIAGDSPTLAASDVAHQLQRLEHRHAYVKIGAEIFDMQRTLDTPARVNPQDEYRRQDQIRAQTRQKYCRPAYQIELEIKRRLGNFDAPPYQEIDLYQTLETWQPPPQTRTDPGKKRTHKPDTPPPERETDIYQILENKEQPAQEQPANWQFSPPPPKTEPRKKTPKKWNPFEDEN